MQTEVGMETPMAKGRMETKTVDILKKSILAPGVVGRACNPSTQKIEQGDQEFKIILYYIANTRPAWSKWDLVSKTSK